MTDVEAAQRLIYCAKILMADDRATMKKARQELTSTSSKLEGLARSKDKEIAKAASEAEKLVDKARRILFDEE